ncbi:SubName: Full=Uncharacterized protein {ECO:0000313/EMBL:CCA77922.1} [Serendipita indica DSM 11827]|nr:SubName: Full=Uncharacterized protein {ECO:0000313/EMBL:CCA77922.1} [Serendipita indica DSM 11827]
MKAEIPANDDLLSFIASIESTLTPSESRHLHQLAAAESTRSQATKHLFQLWTLKEAYVKTLGVGITFELSRIHFDFDTSVLVVDGEPLNRWGIISFGVSSLFSDDVPEKYVAAVCYQRDSSDTETGGVVKWVSVAEDQRLTLVDQHDLIQRVARGFPVVNTS